MGKSQKQNFALFFICSLLFFMSTSPMKKKQRKYTLPPVDSPKIRFQQKKSQTFPDFNQYDDEFLVPKTDSNESLFNAAKLEDFEQFDTLLRQASTDINFQDRDTGKTVVHVAAQKGNIKLLKKIFQNPNKKFDLTLKDKKNRTALRYALENEKHDVEVVRIFFQQDGIIEVFTEDLQILLGRVKGESIRILKEIYDLCVDFSTLFGVRFVHEKLETKNNTIRLLCFALRLGYYDLVHYILENSKTKPHELLNKLFCEKKLDRLEGFLHIATRANFPHIVRLLLEYKADPNLANEDDLITPLHIAAENNSLPIIKILMKENASPCSLNYNGQTALHIAAEMGHVEIVNYFVIYHTEEIKIINAFPVPSPLSIVQRKLRGSKKYLKIQELLMPKIDSPLCSPKNSFLPANSFLDDT